jgi:hypothetical protein
MTLTGGGDQGVGDNKLKKAGGDQSAQVRGTDAETTANLHNDSVVARRVEDAMRAGDISELLLSSTRLAESIQASLTKVDTLIHGYRDTDGSTWWERCQRNSPIAAHGLREAVETHFGPSFRLSTNDADVTPRSIGRWQANLSRRIGETTPSPEDEQTT